MCRWIAYRGETITMERYVTAPSHSLVVQSIRSHLFFAHVRASTGTPTTRPNCHPFAYGRFLFMHNGQIGDWSLIRRRVEALIPDQLYKARIGTTDSEAAFLAILGAGAETDPVG